MRAGHLSLPNGRSLVVHNADEVHTADVAPNKLTTAEGRNQWAGTPRHKHAPGEHRGRVNGAHGGRLFDWRRPGSCCPDAWVTSLRARASGRSAHVNQTAESCEQCVEAGLELVVAADLREGVGVLYDGRERGRVS